MFYMKSAPYMWKPVTYLRCRGCSQTSHYKFPFPAIVNRTLPLFNAVGWKKLRLNSHRRNQRSIQGYSIKWQCGDGDTSLYLD